MVDWTAILEELETVGSVVPSVRSLLQFLQRNRCGRLDETALQQWLQECLQNGARLQSTLARLSYVDRLVAVLADRSLADRTLVQHVRKRPDLLEHVSGGRPQVPLPWQPVLTSFETSLRGLAPLQQARCLEDAARFIAVLGEQDSPDEACFLRWLDQELARCTVPTVQYAFARVERFCAFLQACGHPCNPASQWHHRHRRELGEALRCRKSGQVAPLRKPRYRSFLAPHIEAFIAFKRSLGRQYRDVRFLDGLGHFAQARGVSELGGLARPTLLAFLSSRNWATSTRGEAHQVIREFFRFLTRSGAVPAQANPAQNLPRLRRPPRLPYIFSVREIAALLDELTKAPTQAFNQRLYATMIRLMYSCGLRRREPTRLQVGDVDLEHAVVFIRCTKFGKDRQIPIGPRVCEQLDEYHRTRVARLGQPAAEAAFFVQATGDPVWPGHLHDLFRGACTRAKIGSASRPRPRLHDLRHSFAVHRLYKWYLEGADPQARLPLLSIYMGHVSEESTRHYLHLSQDLLRLAARPMERSLEGWLQEHSKDLAL